MPSELKGGSTIVPFPIAGGETQSAGRRTRRSASVKQLKKMLKKAGLKTTGKKAALTKRAKKAHLKLVKKGGDPNSTGGTVTGGNGNGEIPGVNDGGRRRRRSSSRGPLGVFGL